ncbi:MAG: PH domain-containing protein [Patescibacteria group bacterium]
MFGKFHFQGQKPGEEILLVLHRHWFDILSQIFLIVGMLAILVLGFFYLPFLFPNINSFSGGNIFSFIEVSLAMLIWLVLFIIWIDYYFDVWIVTNRRIVNIEQKGLFVRHVSELEIENIQDITTEVTGVIPTFLDFGDVFIQTAAEKERFLFHNVPDPYGVKDMVMNLQKRIEKEEARDFGEMIRERLKKT